MTQPHRPPEEPPKRTWYCVICGERGTGPTPVKHFQHSDEEKAQRRREQDWLAEQMVREG